MATPSVLVTHSLPQTILSSPTGGTQLQWDTEKFDTDALHVNSPPTDSIYLAPKLPGFYLVFGSIRYSPATTSAGTRKIQLFKGFSAPGGLVHEYDIQALTGRRANISFATVVQFGSGERVYLIAIQDSGATLNVEGGENQSYFGLAYLSQSP